MALLFINSLNEQDKPNDRSSMTELLESFSANVSTFESLFDCDDDDAAVQGLLLFDQEEIDGFFPIVE